MRSHPLAARTLSVAPDPPALARALLAADLRGVALLHASALAPDLLGLDRWSFVAAEPDASSSRLDPLTSDLSFHPAAGALAFVPRWIGVIPYEGRRPALERAAWSKPDTRPAAPLVAPEWHRYPAVLAVHHEQGRVLAVGSDPAAVERLAAAVARRPDAPGE